MGGPISGPGVGLPPPQNYYPSELFNAAQDPSSNIMALNAGDGFVVPAGRFGVQLAPNLIIQFLDPVNNIWALPRTGELPALQEFWSDGYNIRIANLTGCPVAAVVTNAGSGYSQATTTCTSSGSGGSTWQPVVGGALSVTSVTVAGSGYGVPPVLLIPPPPSPGVQATGYCTITGGSVTGVTLNNVGAGYLSAPTPVIVPSPFDPNLNVGTIVQAQATLATVNAGSITAVLCTNSGNAVSSAPTLTISGTGGSNAAATAVLMQTVTGASVFSGGAGFTSGAYLTSVGGVPTATPVNTVPLIEGRDFVPRPVQALLASPVGGSIASVSTIYDGGLFLVGSGAPSAVVTPIGGQEQTGVASITLIMGSGVGTFRMQQFP